MWGGNWKDTVEKVIAKPFTAKTGIPVEFEVGGTLDRLAKARVAKAAPLVDITFTTSHVGRLYMSDGLFQKLDMAKLPNARDLAPEALRSDAHLGVWAYVYTIAYRPDQVKMDITKWADLWDPQLKGKVGMPDFDPSHIITISALLEGGDERSWQKGQERLKRLKPNIAAFFSTDARSQDLMKTGEAPVQVMLSINAFHLIEQGLPVKVVNPTDRPGIVGIDTMAIMAGTKKSDAAHQFIVLEFIPGSLRTGGLTTRNLDAVLSPLYLRYIWDTVVLSALTTVLTLVASYPVAYALARSRSATMRSLLLVLTLAPFFTGAIVRTYAWMLVLGNTFIHWPAKLLFEPAGVLIGLVHFSMPTMILILAAAISHIDRTYERAAASLGARPWRVFWRVTLPLSMPGVVSGSLVVFAWTFSALPTPELLGGGRVKMIANVVKDLALDAFNWPGSAAFAAIALAITFLLLAVVTRALSRAGGAAA